MVSVLGLQAAAPAQEPPKPTVAQQRTEEARAALQKAIDDAKASNKVLLVTFGSDAGRAKANEMMLSVSATAGWVARHAVTFSVTDSKLISELAGARFANEDGNESTVKLTQVAGGDPLFFADGVLEPLDKAGASIVVPNTPKADPKTAAGKGSIAMAMRLDWTLRTPATRSPETREAFRTRHYEAIAPAVWPGSSKGKPPALLPALAGARELARQKKWDEAANAYATAWWETGGGTTAAAIRVGTMAAEMSLVAQQSPGAKERFEGLRTEYARAMDERDMRQVHEYLILCRVVGDHEHNLKFFDEASQSKAAITTLPASDLVSIEWMLPRCHWNDPNEGVSKPGAWCVQVLRQCDRLAHRKDGANLAGAVEYGRWLARVEASRRFAWLLIAANGDVKLDEKALELREAVLAQDASPEMKRSMVAAALAAGQKRAWMGDMLKGIEDDELAAELKK